MALQRLPARKLDFEDETQARPVDDRLIEASRYDAARRERTPVPAPLDVPYESLPSLEMRRPFDTYEAEFAERDPATQIAARESLRQRRAEVAHDAREPQEFFPPPAQTAALPATREGSGPLDPWAERREGSGARARPQANRYAAPVPAYDESGPHDSRYLREDENVKFRSGAGWSNPPPAQPVPHIPPAPRVPHEAQPPFVMGVQPLRAAQPYATPQPYPAPQHLTPPPGPMPAAPALVPAGTVAASPRAVARTPMPAPMPARMPNQVATVPPMARQPVGPMVAAAPAPKSGVGRLVTFLAGAIFGISFMFFASGFVPRMAQKEEPLFPPAPPAPAEVATQVAAPPAAPATAEPAANTMVPTTPVTAPPPVVAAPVAPPNVIAPPPAEPASPAAAVAAPAPPTTGTVERRSPPSRPASPPRYARRPAPPPPPPQTPRPLNTGVDAPEPEPPRSPPPSTATSDAPALNDLLNQALAP